MARAHIATALAALAALLVFTLHLSDQLNLTSHFNNLRFSEDGGNGFFGSGLYELGSERGQGRTKFLLGVGKADITG